MFYLAFIYKIRCLFFNLKRFFVMFIYFTKTCLFPNSFYIYRCISFTVQNFDYYKVLGVQPNATNDEIKKAYLQKCKEYHPDRNKGSKQMQSKFVQANEAYNVLSNVNKRREYDARQKSSFHQSPYQSNKWSNQTQSRPEDVYQQYQQYENRRQTNQEWSRHRRDPMNEYWQRVYENQNFSRNQKSFDKNNPFGFDYNSRNSKMPIDEKRFFTFFFVVLFCIICLRIFIAVKSYNNRSAISYPDPSYAPNSNQSRFNNKKMDISDIDVKTESV